MTSGENSGRIEAEEPLIRTVDLTRHFTLGGMFGKKQVLHAVDDFNLTIHEHEIVALVGESGSGKSTMARLLAKVYPPTRGEIHYRGRRLSKLRPPNAASIRCNRWRAPL